MRAVVQRVSRASVKVEQQAIGAIGAGLLVFLGIGKDDGPEDSFYIASKVASLRIFEDEQGKLNRSLLETTREVLVVSQFTLYGDCRHGRRPSMSSAAPSDKARELYQMCIEQMQKAGLNVKTGAFQAHMMVELINDGPVTILLDSKKEF